MVHHSPSLILLESPSSFLAEPTSTIPLRTENHYRGMRDDQIDTTPPKRLTLHPCDTEIWETINSNTTNFIPNYLPSLYYYIGSWISVTEIVAWLLIGKYFSHSWFFPCNTTIGINSIVAEHDGFEQKTTRRISDKASLLFRISLFRLWPWNWTRGLGGMTFRWKKQEN